MKRTDSDAPDEMPVASRRRSGRNPRSRRHGGSSGTARTEHSDPQVSQILQAVVERENMLRALHRVESNNGAAGVDGMTVDELRPYLKTHWVQIKERLMDRTYMPQAVLAVDIPKPGGKGTRRLGIPTVVDRLIQQALHQILGPIFEPTFSEHSYGFRPGRSAHQAVQAARDYVAAGRRWVVDMDLEKFFDRVNHDMLMARVARCVKDKRVLGLVRGYLQSGMMVGSLEQSRSEGTPQGGPLSPLLSNILLTDLDRELERRGHCFCRYADDCNIYVRSERAGQRVMESITQFLSKRLKLKVNRDKSGVDRPWKRKFLGYSMTSHRDPRLKVAPASVRRLKETLRRTFRRGRGRNLKRFIAEELKPLLRGWIQYFRLSGVKGTFTSLDGWIRRHLRCILWRQWKRPSTRVRRLVSLGLTRFQARRCAYSGRGPWFSAGARLLHRAVPNRIFDRLGLVSLHREHRRLHGKT